MTIRDIPEEVMNRFKAWCALRGWSLQRGIIEVMREKGSTIAEIVPKDSRAAGGGADDTGDAGANNGGESARPV